MNLKSALIVLFFTLLAISSFGQYNHIQKLGNLATIALPDTPKVVDKDGNKIYVSRHNGVIFVAQAGDVSGGFKDLFRKNNADSLYNVYIKSMVDDSKGKLFYRNKLMINGHPGVEFGCTGVINGQQTFRYHRAVSLNDTILMCGIWAADSLSKDNKNLVSFFNGFKTKSDSEISSARAEQWGFRTGKVIGYLMIIAIPILLGLGIVFMIKRIAYRKSKTDHLS